MSDEIAITIDNSELKTLLNSLKDKTQNAEPLMRSLAEIMYNAVQMQFETEGYGKWPKLKESTKKARRKKGTWPGKILQDSLQLINSIQTEATNDTARVSTNKPYAPKHQFGFSGSENVSSYKRKTKKGETSVKAFVRVLNLESRSFFEIDDFHNNQLLEAVKGFITGD